MTGMEHAGHGDSFDTTRERVDETADREHVGMEHAIEQVTNLIGDGLAASRKFTPIDASIIGNYFARALAEAGLLAPAPLRVDQAAAEATGRYGVRTERGDEVKAFCAGAMWAADRAEGDGRAEQ